VFAFEVATRAAPNPVGPRLRQQANGSIEEAQYGLQQRDLARGCLGQRRSRHKLLDQLRIAWRGQRRRWRARQRRIRAQRQVKPRLADRNPKLGDHLVQYAQSFAHVSDSVAVVCPRPIRERAPRLFRGREPDIRIGNLRNLVENFRDVAAEGREVRIAAACGVRGRPYRFRVLFRSGPINPARRDRDEVQLDRISRHLRWHRKNHAVVDTRPFTVTRQNAPICKKHPEKYAARRLLCRSRQ